ncbi:putative serine esterase [Scheffersomyces xylosifermentans]|uniref:putative serine esterase n=1 Tax=Scheffersomyces xylosifermentans TaxID=1304137 RepID=UPI00315DA78D
MANSSSTLVETREEENAHLFVLVHGLWGSPNHMHTIERFLKDLIPSVSNEKIAILKPSSFRFWKTYDGLELNSQKIIAEIFYEIETLKQKNNYNVTKISIIGYSLGGLLSRYVIGILEEIGFFDKVEPIFFTTFATPHVGVQFFAKNIFDNTANRLGPYLFGPSGLQLFVKDTEKALRVMADPSKRYYQGLKRFQKHILLANVRNDRTVAFFTSYITEYSPFDDWRSVKIKYLKNLPEIKVGTVQTRPKFVDLTRSHVLSTEAVKTFEGNTQEDTSFLRSNRIVKILVVLVLASFFLPFWIPLVLSTSVYVSIYSMIKIRFITRPQVDKHWAKVRDTVYGSAPVDPKDAKIGEEQRNMRAKLARQESFKGDTSRMTGNAMENMLYAESRFVAKNSQFKDDEEAARGSVEAANQYEGRDDDEDDDGVDGEMTSIVSVKNNQRIVSVNIEANDSIVNTHLATLKLKDYERFPLFTPKAKLEMDEDKLYIIKSLNKLDWVKIPVYLDCWNAHDGIVSRKGPRSNARGTSTIGLWCSVLRNHLKETFVSEDQN